jgi:AraC family transcriptional regulator
MEYMHPINCAIDYVEANLTQEIDLSEVAAAAGYSPFHLSRLFRTVIGETPGGCIRKRRLCEAARQLLISRRRILDIALDHQFCSQAAFTRAFRATFGISPGAYRKRGRLARLTHRITLRQPRLCYVNGERGRDARLALPRRGIGQVLPARVLGLSARHVQTLDHYCLLFY